MKARNLLVGSCATLLSVFAVAHFSGGEKEWPVQKRNLVKAIEKNIVPAALTTKETFAAEILPEKQVKVVSWRSHCGGHDGGYLTRNVREEVSHCGGHEVVHIINHISEIKIVESEITQATPAEKKQEEIFVPELREMSFKVYPNPMSVEARLEIENYNDEPYTFELYDLSGKLVMKDGNITNSVYVIPRNDLSAGIYIYRVIMNFNNAPLLKSGKIVVE